MVAQGPRGVVFVTIVVTAFVAAMIAALVAHRRSTSVLSAQGRIASVGGTQRSDVGPGVLGAPLGTHGLRRAPHQP